MYEVIASVESLELFRGVINALVNNVLDSKDDLVASDFFHFHLHDCTVYLNAWVQFSSLSGLG